MQQTNEEEKEKKQSTENLEERIFLKSIRF